MRVLPLAAAALAAAGVGAHAADLEVYKCTTQQGAVSYQPLPCPPSSAQKKVELAPFSAGFDPSEGGELFKREAALDRRRAEAAKEEAAKESEAAAGDPAVSEDGKMVGPAHAPALATQGANDVQRQPFVANAPGRH
jgi:Domain of unknown function (DUF4124)